MTIHKNAMFVCRENVGNNQNRTKIQNVRFKKKKKIGLILNSTAFNASSIFSDLETFFFLSLSLSEQPNRHYIQTHAHTKNNMKPTEELLVLKFPARDKSHLATQRAPTRSDNHDDSTSTSTSSEVAVTTDTASSTGRARNSLISSSKCVSSEILRTRSVQSFLNDQPLFPPPPIVTPIAVTSLTSSSTNGFHEF